MVEVAATVPEPLDGGSDLATPEGTVGDSMSVAVWTLVSRVTGVLRGITIAAVLGATYFANTFQFTNSLPNLVFYGLLAGSMFSSLLVPALVGHIDSGDRQATARTAGGLLGMALVGMLAIVPVAALATPWLLKLGSAGAVNAAAAGNQVHIGAVLVLLLLPQVPLYAIVGTATAVMNAHRRFALAAAAPALENIGTIAVLGVVAVLYSHVATEQTIPLSLVLLLGLGTTGAVALHASVQWWGARRVGIVLVPKSGWRDPQVRTTIQRALPALVQAALVALLFGALSLAADRVPGGVVAFQLATNFYFLPIALAASPVALSLVPRLSRMTAPGQAGMFRDTYLRGLALACFFSVPAATAYAVLAGPIAGTIGVGAFGAAGGRDLIAAAVRGLAPAIVGETLFLVTTYACYARKDTARPLRAAIIQAVICAAGIAIVVHVHGTGLLTGLGLALSAGSLVASGYLVRNLRKGLPHGGERTLRPILQTLACSAIMALPAWAAADFLASRLTSGPGRAVTMLVVSLGGAGIYFAAQAAMGAEQLDWLTAALRDRWRQLSGRLPAPAVRQADRFGRALAGLAGLAGLLARAVSVAGPVLRRRRLDALLLLGIVMVGALAGIKVKYALFAVVAIGIAGWVMARPPVAAYLLIFATPLIVGISAGSVVPLLRPNEALIVLLGAAIGLRWLTGLRTGGLRMPRMDGIDVTLIALGVASSVLPLAMMLVRQRPITKDDVLYCIVLWKLFGEYIIVRSVISTREQAMRCLWLSMGAAAIVGFIGIVQSLGVAGVPGLIAKYTASSGTDGMVEIGRGSSLLGLPAATADLAILNLGIAVAMIARGYPRRLLLGGLIALYALTVVAAAEFATVIGLVVALVALMVLTRSGRLAVYMVPVALVGGVLLWPVIELRLAGFHSTAGLPLSWVDRLYNLRTFFWPVLFSDHNWIFGVQPSPRIATSSKAEGFIWIESGYTWLLWGGGIPLLASYIAFAVAALRKSLAYARRADVTGITATAMTAAMCSQVVLMTFDPHLTFRGSGDALFLLLALIRKLPARRTSPAAGRSPLAAASVAPPVKVLA